MITDGTHTYQTKGSCARTITYTAKEGKIYDIQFNGGCNGNLKMLSKLLEGMDAEEILQADEVFAVGDGRYLIVEC